MFSIKVVVGNSRVLVGKSGKPVVYKTKAAADKAAKKIDKDLNPKVVPAIPVHEI